MSLSSAVETLEVDSGLTDRLHISDLHVGHTYHDSYIEASVALIWPYSSSNGKLSLLLVEKDVPLHKSRGQIKVTLHNQCAKECARTHIGIGDTVRLSLNDASWTETKEQLSTPGKKLAFDLDFYTRITLEVRRANGVSLRVSVRDLSPSLVEQQEAVSSNSSNYAAINIVKPRAYPSTSANRFGTPKRISSGSFVDASLDPFAEDDGYIVGRGRKRTRFTRTSGAWTLLDEDDQLLAGNSVSNQAVSTNELDVFEEPVRSGVADLEEQIASSPGGDGSILQPQMRETPVEEADPDATRQFTSTDTGNRQAERSSPVKDTVTSPLVVPKLIETEQNVPQGQPKLPPVLIDLTSPIEAFPPVIPYPSVLQHSQPEGILQESQRDAVKAQLDYTSSASTDHAVAARESNNFADADTVHSLVTVPSVMTASEIRNETLPSVDEHKAALTSSYPEILDLTSPTEEQHSHHEQLSTAKAIETDNDAPNDQVLLTEGQPINDLSYFDNPDPLGFVSSQQLAASNAQTASISAPPLAAMLDSSLSRSSIPDPQLDTNLLQQADMVARLHPNTASLSSGIQDFAKVHEVLPVIYDLSNEPERTGLSLLQQELPSPVSNLSFDPTIQHTSQVIMEPFISHEAPILEAHEEIVDLDALQHQINEQAAGFEKLSSDAFVEDEDMYSSPTKQNPPDRISMTSPQGKQSERSATESSPSSVYSSSVASGSSAEDEQTDMIRPSNSAAGLHVFDGNIGELNRSIRQNDLQEQQNLSQSRVAKSRSQSTDAESISNRIQAPTHKSDDVDIANVSDRGIHDNQVDASASSTSASSDTSDSESSDNSTSNRSPRITTDEYNLGEAGDDVAYPAVAHEKAISLQRNDHVLKAGTHQVLTPVATQESVENTAVASRMDVTIDFPPTPSLTQPVIKVSGVVPSTLSQAIAMQKEDDEQDLQLPDMSDIQDTAKSRRISQRLTRKNYTSDPIGSDYFTPRRLPLKPMSSPGKTDRLDTENATTDLVSSRGASEPASPSPIAQNSISITAIHEELPSTNHGISTSMSYFPHLASLGEYFEKLVDVIAVCSADSKPAQRAKAGPKDFYMTFHLVDRSLGDGSSRSAQVFRPRKLALPVGHRGDIVLLRNMKVQSKDHKPMLLSTESSAWAVFSRSVDDLHISINGPPVEYSQEEEAYCQTLFEWWQHSSMSYPELSQANNETNDKQAGSPIMTRSQRRKRDMSPVDATLANDSIARNGMQSQDDSMMPQSASIRASIDNISPSRSSHNVPGPKHRRRSGRRSESVVHELRDGTTYVDDRTSEDLIHELRDGVTYIDDV